MKDPKFNTEVSQKVFNRNVTRITDEAINHYDIRDRKSQKLLKEYFSETLNDLIDKNPGIILDKVRVDLD